MKTVVKTAKKKAEVKTRKAPTKKVQRKLSPEAKKAAHNRAIAMLKDIPVATVKSGSVEARLKEAGALWSVKFRKSQNMTAQALAAKLGIDPSGVSHLERGDYVLSLPRIVDMAKRLALKPSAVAAEVFSLAGL